MTTLKCWNTFGSHYGIVRDYSDGVDTHPLCEACARSLGFLPREPIDALLSRVEAYLASSTETECA